MRTYVTVSSGRNAHPGTSFGRTRPGEDAGGTCEHAATSAGAAKTIRRRRHRGRIPGSGRRGAGAVAKLRRPIRSRRRRPPTPARAGSEGRPRLRRGSPAARNRRAAAKFPPQRRGRRVGPGPTRPPGGAESSGARGREGESKAHFAKENRLQFEIEIYFIVMQRNNEVGHRGRSRP